MHERLAGVVIECLPYDAFITRYDRPGALFYLDPPYWNSETCYGAGLFERADFARLAEILRELKGRFLLSLNDVPGVRETFAGFAFQELKATYSIPADRNRFEAKELLISGP